MKEEKKYIKVENVSRGNVHQVPDQYFNKLNVDIRKRIEKEKPVSKWTHLPVMKLGIPLSVAAVLFIAYFIFWSPTNSTAFDVESLLADVKTEAILDYLEELDLSEDEILASIDIDFLAEGIDEEYGDFIQVEIEDEDIIEIMNELELEDYNFTDLEVNHEQN